VCNVCLFPLGKVCVVIIDKRNAKMGTINMGRGTGSPAAAAGPFSILLLIKSLFSHFSMLV
jgi:hypothetical protein